MRSLAFAIGPSWLFILAAPLICLRAQADVAAVVSGSAESTEIGLAILERGGTAADSAVAVSLALGVAEPYGSGLGGKIAILYYDAGRQKVSFIDGMDQAPGRFDVSDYTQLPEARRKRSFQAVCVPGLVAGLAELHKEHGALNWKDLVQPAADLAHKGFIMTDHDEGIFKSSLGHLKNNPETSRLYLNDGRLPKQGTRLPNSDLAKTLEMLGRDGPKSFYDGPIAEALVKAVQENGGWITQADMRSYRVRVRPPLSLDWMGYTVYSSPSPTTGGATVLLTLKALESVPEIKTLSVNERYHTLGSGLLIAYDYYQSFGDWPAWKDAQKQVFSSPTYKALAQNMHVQMKPTRESGKPPRSSTDSNTTHFIVVDAHGNIACVTQSLSSHFGACVIAPGAGFLLNNTMSNFAVQTRSSPNYIAEGKRPRSTIAPTIILKQGEPSLAIGSPAGQRIPTGIAQVIMETLIYQTDLQEAIDAPRYHLRRAKYRTESQRYVEMENDANKQLVRALKQYGWDVHLRTPNRYYFGGVNAILFTPEGELVLGADARRSNVSAQINP